MTQGHASPAGGPGGILAGQLLRCEHELAAELPYIPLAVRYKLDRAGCKISLAQWTALPLERRRALVHGWAGDADDDVAAFFQAVSAWIRAATGESPREIASAPKSGNTSPEIAAEVVDAAANCEPPLTQPEWAGFSSFERYVLYRLVTARHDRERFEPTLAEFREQRTSKPLE